MNNRYTRKQLSPLLNYPHVPLGILLLVTLPNFALSETPQQADMIVYGDYVVTMDDSVRNTNKNTDKNKTTTLSADNRSVIKNGAVVITGNRISAVGQRRHIDRDYRAKRTLSGKGRVVMPGLINGHTHSAMTLFRGMSDDQELMSWLNNYIFPMEARFVDADFVKVGTQLACWEMIRGGTTTFVDMYFHPHTIADVVEDCGLRAVIAAPSIDFPSPGFKGWDDSFKAAVDFVKKRQGKHERITPAFAPHAPFTVAPDHLQQVTKKAHQLKAPVSIHIAESPSEPQIIAEKYGATPLKHVAKQGLLDTTLIAAHMVHLTTEDIAMLVGKQVGAIHNPTSNLKLASGYSPVVKMLNAGALVGLGTDGAASNNDLDLWEEIRLAALIHKVNAGDPTVIPAITALKMATHMGAAAIGMGDIIGRLKPGMRADMIQISLDSPRLAPLYNVISHLVYTIDASDVVTTIVSGNILMENGKVLTVDGEKIKAAVAEKAAAIAKQLSTGERTDNK